MHERYDIHESTLLKSSFVAFVSFVPFVVIS